MTIWIVLRNDKIDEVFDNEDAAKYHALKLNKKWAVTDVIEKEVRTIDN